MSELIQRLRKFLCLFRYQEDDDSLHPWYGPCDGFAGGRCAECLDVRLDHRPTSAELIAMAMSSRPSGTEEEA